MLRLTLFGGVSLTRGGVPVTGAATRRRALALLALLAASRPRGITRDALCALLWPDAEPEAGRHSLHQLLFTTRRALGVDGLVVGTTTLALDPNDVECDVWEFERALHDRQLERAVALYAGPFADGFSPDDVPEAGARLDLHRATYARARAEALEQLARAAQDRGDFVGSARWWRMLVDADPLGARAARECIAALAGAGERAQALQVARVHAELVRRELGAEPDAEVLAWIDRLKDAPRTTPAAPPSATSGASSAATNGAGRADRLRARVERAVGGRYRVEALLEEETLAACFAARAREGRGDAVEIVVVQPRVAAHAAGERFADTMGRVARLVDPHLLPVLDAGASDDLLYFVAAPRPALSLKDRLQRDGALPIDEAVALARAIAAGLGCAHASGLRHGDLRPRHVYLTGSAVAPSVVRGVGVADALRTEEHADRSTAASVGAPAYMSPEQLAGDPGWDARSDVYALGSILYEMLAGEPPFGRVFRSGTFARKLSERAPSIRERRERVTPALAEVIERCLARVPADRYASGSDVVRALSLV